MAKDMKRATDTVKQLIQPQKKENLTLNYNMHNWIVQNI